MSKVYWKKGIIQLTIWSYLKEMPSTLTINDYFCGSALHVATCPMYIQYMLVNGNDKFERTLK